MASKMSHSDRIIKTKATRVEVPASPGSGKTWNLIARMHHLLANGVTAKRILVLSFSNTSVCELGNRMASQIRDTTGDNSPGKTGASKAKGVVAAANINLSQVTVKTAHSFALSLIPHKFGEVKVLTDKSGPRLLSTAIRSVRKAARSGKLWPTASPAVKQQRLAQLEDLLQPWATSTVFSLFEVARASRMKIAYSVLTGRFEDLKLYVRVLVEVKRRYAAIKEKRGLIDFGDMLVRANDVLKSDKGSVLFTHILVDEYQDCSPAQVHLLARLAKLEGRSIMVFGDPNQAIFAFAGARYTPLSSVLDGVKTLDLPLSRRLTAQTAATASAVAQLSPENAIQTNREGVMPVLITDTSLNTQTAHVVRDIQRLIAHGALPAEIVVLARLKAQLTPVEQALLAVNIQTTNKGMTRDRKHVLHVLRLVRVVERCEKKGTTVSPDMLRSALSRLPDFDDKRWKRESLALGKVSGVPSFEGRYQQCAKVYLRLMGGVRNDPQLQADVNRWAPIARAHGNARAMQAAVRAMERQAVVTGTIHSAKGGEWDHVLVVGVTDGLLPVYLSRDDRGFAEERNLLYVAITRARDSVRLYHAPVDHARSRQRFEDVSRFLDEGAVRSTMRFK
jgi:DNA helicase-2/ATP-dependent DNA helicase PcrA